MLHLKSKTEIEKIRASCRVAAEAMQQALAVVVPGVATSRLDHVADDYIRRQGAVASAKGYRGYPRSICVSVNDEVVHGIPGTRRLLEGDILSVDIAVKKDGYHGDMNVTTIVGHGDMVTCELRDVTRRSLEVGLQACVVDNRLGDVGHAVQKCAEAEGCSIVREYCGHGIGRSFHEEPQVLHFGTPGVGRRLQPGMVFTVEPMVNRGGAQVRVLEDEWTAVTEDGDLSAQYEHTVAVTRNGPDILSRFADLPF